MLERLLGERAPEIVPVFVYGTLRPGGALYRHWLEGVVVEHHHGTAPGYGLWCANTHSYPMLCPTPGATAQGDILWVKRGPQLNRTVAMECNAGYTLTTIDVACDKLILPTPAVTFLWERSTRGLHPVPFNDWNAT